MYAIKKLYVLFRTSNEHWYSGTNSRLQVTIETDEFDSQGNPIKKVRTLSLPKDTPQWDAERGQSNLYVLTPDPKLGLEDRHLFDGTTRVEILGRDLWEPDHILVWAERDYSHPMVVVGSFGAPDWKGDAVLSRDTRAHGDAGVKSVELVKPYYSTTNRADDYLIVVETHDTPDSGTDSAVELVVPLGTYSGALQTVIPLTPDAQADLERGQVNTYLSPVQTAGSVQQIRSWLAGQPWNKIELRTNGKDLWRPKRLYVFAIGWPSVPANGIHIECVVWEDAITKTLSRDPAEGTASTSFAAVN